MNLFGTGEIDVKIEYNAVEDSLAKYKTNIELKVENKGGKFIDFEISDKFVDDSKNTIKHTVDEVQLRDLIKQLSEIETTFLDNSKNNKDYPINEVEKLYFAILENYCSFKKYAGWKIPKPKISVHLDIDNIWLTAIDFRNSHILLNQVISTDFLKNSIDKEAGTVYDIHEVLINTINSELISAMKDIKGISNVNCYYELEYLGFHNAYKIKEIGIENIIKEYLFNNTTIEDDVINLFN